MRTETYLNAYFMTRDRLEQVRLGGKRRRRLVRQERKLEAQLREEYHKLREEYDECRREGVFLWVVVGCQLAVLVFLAAAKIAWPWI